MSQRPPQKRMRLGTRSCAECRRRKVRCIFETNAQVCGQCASHGAPCAAQRQGCPQTGDLKLANEAQERLDKLESMVRHISGSIGLDIDSSSITEFEATLEALKRPRPRHPQTPESNVDSSSASMSCSLNPSQLDSHTADAGYPLEQAPLLNLFRTAMLIEKDNSQSDKEHSDTPADKGVRSCITSLNTLLPNPDDLTLILETTEKYWLLWCPFPQSVFSASNDNQSSKFELAKSFILDSLGPGRCPTTVARAVLCLALCIQQLPTKSQYQQSLPKTANVLVNSFLSGAETLLSFEGSNRSVDGGECWMLLAKLYINTGKPRKAWLSCRRALDIALLLGLNRLGDSIDPQRSHLWSSIWQMERNTALLIGVPYGIPESNLSLSMGQTGQPVALRVMNKISIISGHINDRNQSLENANYSTTMQIEQELQECRNDMPPDWWDYGTTPLPLEFLYRTTGIKMQYLALMKYLHLPYMLTDSVDKLQERSKIAGLNAAREIMKSYEQYRESCGPSLVMCDLIDFQAFTGAVLVIISLLSQSSDPNSVQEIIDWELIQAVRKNLDRVSIEMECCVAGQAAQLLDYLSKSYQGTYSGPELYEAVIPYFGKVRIRQIKKQAHASVAFYGFSQENITPLSINAVEFSANISTTADQWLTRNCFSEAELDIDWTSFFDLNTTTYEWNHVFN